MVIDTSALLAILHDEPERRAFNEAIEAADTRAMSMANFVEASIVIESRYGAEGIRDLDLFIERAAIELVDVTLAQGHAARRALGIGIAQPVQFRHGRPLAGGAVPPPAWRAAARPVRRPAAAAR